MPNGKKNNLFFGLFSFFDGISTFLGYSIPNLSLRRKADYYLTHS